MHTLSKECLYGHALLGKASAVIDKALNMKHCIAIMSTLLGACLASSPSYGLPQGCRWDPNYPGPAQVTFGIPNVLNVPYDAPVGTLIGGKEIVGYGVPNPRTVFECQNNSREGPLVNITYNAQNVAPLARFDSTLPRIALPYPEHNIISTNIPGVGVSILMQNEIDGTSIEYPYFLLQGPEARVPFTSVRNHDHLANARVTGQRYFISFIKTGVIPAGSYTFDPGYEIIRSEVTNPLPEVNTVLHFSFSGNLISSGCNIGTDPVTPNPVDLGEFDAKDFEQAGAGSPPVRFELNLIDCQPPAQDTVPRVHLTLDPDNGSSTIDAANGVFSTGSGTTGGGVAFQILKQDAIAPMPLHTNEPIMTLPTGDRKMLLNVRLVKHTGPVVPGTLTGALRFLLTYE